MSSEVILEFNNVAKRYSKQAAFNNSFREQILGVFSTPKSRSELYENEFWALKDIDLKVYEGECVGLCGPNGSGKSTLLKLISNITFPTMGEVNVYKKVAPLIELGAGFHLDLSGIENIYMNGTILGMSVRDVKKKIDEIIAFSELQDFINAPVKKYSSGMALRLAFSIAIHSPAETFLFDEVLAVGDESFRKKCADKILELKASGKTIIIVSHDIHSLKKYCNRMIYLEKGELVREDLIQKIENEVASK